MSQSQIPATRLAWQHIPAAAPAPWGHSIWVLLDDGVRTRWTITNTCELRRWWFDGTAIINERHRNVVFSAVSLEDAQAIMIDCYLHYVTPAEVTPPALLISDAQFATEELPIDRPGSFPETQGDDAPRIVNNHPVAPSKR